jgi:hypothetical protein
MESAVLGPIIQIFFPKQKGRKNGKVVFATITPTRPKTFFFCDYKSLKLVIAILKNPRSIVQRNNRAGLSDIPLFK